jgi:hypothetical protein
MRLAFVSFPLSKVGALSALGLWARRHRSACSHRFKLGDDHYAGTDSSIISTMTVSSVASAACLDGSVRRGLTFFGAACLAHGLIPNFLAFVFTVTRGAAFLALAFAPVCLAAFLEAELTFLCAPFRVSKPSPFVPMPAFFA